MAMKEDATHTAHNEHNRRVSISSARIEPAMPTIKRLQTYPLDRMVTGIDESRNHSRTNG